MPSISKIRFTNVVYDNGHKRYIDTTFRFDGFNGILLLENGAGKTVFVQTLIQAVLPRKSVAQRKIQETLQLSNSVAHIAVEWILEDQPRRYALTAVSLFMNSKDQLASQEFAMEYTGEASVRLDTLPLIREEGGKKRSATREEMAAYFRGVAEQNMSAKFFSENDTLQSYGHYIEDHFKIIPSEWNKITAINETEGGVEGYFANCRTTGELVDKLLIPTVEEGLSAENGQAGNGFATLFASQRKHFKKQMQLKRRIEEMTRILAELGKYTEVKKAQQEAEQGLLQDNRQLKAYYQQLLYLLDKRQQEQEHVKARQLELEQATAKNQQVLVACEVIAAQNQAETAQKQRDTAVRAQAEARQMLLQKQTEANNLRYAKLREAQQTEQQNCADKEKALAELDVQAGAQAVKQELQVNSAKLHGYFLRKENKLQANQRQIENSLAEVQQEQQKARREQQSIIQQQEALQSERDRNDGQIKNLVAQQERIEQELFADSLHQNPVEQQRAWQREQQEMQKRITDYQHNVDFYTDEGKKAQQKLTAVIAEMQSLQKQLHNLDLRKHSFDQRAEAVLQELSKWPRTANIASSPLELYQRAEFFVQQLGDDIIGLEAKQQEFDWQRRQSYRWLDVYGKLDEFVADPVLLKKIDAWSSDFYYLKSGAELFRSYSNAMPDKQQKLYARYPFWAASVITTSDEIEMLLGRLQKAANEFLAPVFVLTEQEVRAIADGEEVLTSGRQVVPTYWQNIMPASFHTWLQKLQTAAKQADVKWQENQRDLSSLHTLLGQLQHFLQTQPFQQYQDNARQLRTAQEQQTALQYQLAEEKRNVEQCRENVEKFRTSLLQSQQRDKDLKVLLRHLDEYFALQKQQRALLARQSKIRQELAKVKENLAQYETRLNALQAQHEEQKAQHSALREQMRQLKELLYWQDVQTAEPMASEERYEILSEQRRRLLNRLEGANESRTKLETELAGSRKELKRLAGELQRLQDTVETVLDADFSYPLDGAEREQILVQEQREAKKICRQRDTEAAELISQYDRAAGKMESATERYRANYAELLMFTETVAIVREKAEAEKVSLKQAVVKAKEQLQAVLTELRQLEKFEQELLRKNERLGFNADDVQAALVDRLDEQQTCAALRTVTMPCLDIAEKSLQNVAVCHRQSEQQKEAFISYCEKKVRDEKMRRSMVDGVRSKDSYADFLHWKLNSRKRLEQAIELSETEQKNNNEQIAHMINQMVTHLREVCHGLIELAAKTRIKIGETTKDIFMVQIPDWEEGAARTAVRSYLETLTKELDGADYHDEFGREDTAKVQAFLQKRLRTQQVLLDVLSNRPIKVRCRKATSNNTFSERPYSWEESNKWSGGETWSKNMALFLGCLNYLSEKRCHIRKAKYNTRVVIADNPFGKASSDHVLSPVFFIAEKLGFQIIALTAHQEGSFIRKYFPIVYSCRFAEMANKQSKVLLPEKEIKTAFFEQHHPESLARLEEYEQLGLF